MLTKEQTQWLAALRSGNYTIAKSYLERKGGFCCLGVACDLFLKDTRKEHEDGVIAYADETSSAPMALVKLLGLRNRIGGFKAAQLTDYWREKINYNYSSLTELNDVASWDFTTIANFIEDNAGALFNVD